MRPNDDVMVVVVDGDPGSGYPDALTAGSSDAEAGAFLRGLFFGLGEPDTRFELTVRRPGRFPLTWTLGYAPPVTGTRVLSVREGGERE